MQTLWDKPLMFHGFSRRFSRSVGK